MINKVSSIAVWNSKIIFIAVISIAAPAVIAGFMRSEARDSGAQNTPPLLELKNTINTDAFPMSLVVKDKTIYTVNANGNTLQIFQYIKNSIKKILDTMNI